MRSGFWSEMKDAKWQVRAHSNYLANGPTRGRGRIEAENMLRIATEKLAKLNTELKRERAKKKKSKINMTAIEHSGREKNFHPTTPESIADMKTRAAYASLQDDPSKEFGRQRCEAPKTRRPRKQRLKKYGLSRAAIEHNYCRDQPGFW